MGEMRVLEGCAGIVVAQQPADGEDVLSRHDGNAGECVPQIMQPDIPQTGLGAQAGPEIADRRHADRPPGSG